jgi:hypothetical protein
LDIPLSGPEYRFLELVYKVIEVNQLSVVPRFFGSWVRAKLLGFRLPYRETLHVVLDGYPALEFVNLLEKVEKEMNPGSPFSWYPASSTLHPDVKPHDMIYTQIQGLKVVFHTIDKSKV